MKLHLVWLALLAAQSLIGQSNVSVISYGAAADGIMRTDASMAASSAVLTSPSATFSASDVGKYVQVIGAGPGGTSHSDGSMSAGVAVLTSSSGTFASTDVGRGIIVLGAGASGGNLVTTIAAFSSATSVTLNALASHVVAGAAYYYGGMTLEGTLQSVQNSTTITLSAPAWAPVTNATYAYGTDNHAAFQSAVDAVGQTGGGTVNVPQPASCPGTAVCGYVIKASDQMTARIPGAVKIRYNNVSLIGASPQTNLFCRGAWASYFNSIEFPGQTATIRGGCLAIGDNGGPNGTAGEAVSNVTISRLHLYGMTNGNTYNVSFDPTLPPLATTGDGWDITHKGIHLWDNSAFSNILVDSVIIQDFKGENIYSGGSILTGIVISNSTLTNFNGDGISMLAADLQVLNNTITNGSNAGVENATMSATSAALVRQLYQSNTVSGMAREGINIVGVDSGIAAGSIQIVDNYLDTIGQISGSGAQSAIFINPQAVGNVGPSNVVITGNTCHDCFAFGLLETSGTTQVSGNTFVVDQYNCSYFFGFMNPLTNVTISGNNGYFTASAVAKSNTLGSVYMIDPGYKTGNFDWTNVNVQNNVWNFPGVPNYIFVTSSGPGFQILSGYNVIWQGDSCQGCTYPDQNHGLVNLALGSMIEPYGPVVYVTDNQGPVTATLNASKEQNGSQVQIVNVGVEPVTFAADSNLSLSSSLTLPGSAMSSVIFVYNATIGKFIIGGPITVSVSPQIGSLSVNQTLQLTATVTGTSNTAVTWSILSGGAGSVSTTGLYTAPASITTQQTVTVRATSVADPTKNGSATVTLIPVTITVNPQTGSRSVNQTLQLTATVTGTGNTAVTWSILSGGAGSVSTTGLYTAPASITTQQTVTVQAASSADTTKTATATITLTPVSVTVGPPSTSLSVNQTWQLTATVTGSSNTTVTWSILSGGAGSVSTTGLYTAPATILTQQIVTVRATSSADATKTATATITLTVPPITAVARVGAPVICALGGNVSTGSCNYTATTGNFLVVTCSSQNSQSSFRVTDAKSNAYVEDGFATNGVTTSLFHAANVTGGAVNPTCTGSGTAGNGLIVTVTEYSGVVSSNPVDGKPISATGSGGSANSGKTTTTGTSDLLVGAAISDSVPNCNSSKIETGWTQVQFENNQQSYCLMYGDRLNVTGGTYNFTTTFTNSNNWGAITAAYK